MEVPSPSPTASTYDYVYDKDSDQYVLERSPDDAQLTKLHWVVLANLVLLFIFCFITVLTSGLVFGHNVASDDCLGQSWVMFSVRRHISQRPRGLLLPVPHPNHTTLHEQQGGQQTAASCILHAACRLTGELWSANPLL